MSSLKVDNITGRSNTGFTGSVKSDGGNTTTDLQQGLAKVFTRYSMSGTAAQTDSFNVSSFADITTTAGIGQITYTSNMNNADYNCTSSCGELTGGGNRVIGMRGGTQAPSTSSVAFGGFNTSFSAIDLDFNCVTIHGDLA